MWHRSNYFRVRSYGQSVYYGRRGGLQDPELPHCKSYQRLQDDQAIFKYHFDERSRLNNALNGLAYHGFEVVYLFGNLDNKLNARERAMGREIASAWIKFVRGHKPWRTAFWDVWGPDSLSRLETEEEDEHVRFYSRFRSWLVWGARGLWDKYLVELDRLLMKRGKLEHLGTITLPDHNINSRMLPESL